jgi:hypothetical protein
MLACGASAHCKQSDRSAQLDCGSVAIPKRLAVRDRDATESVGVPVVPSCLNCHDSSKVRPVPLSEHYPGVQYWRCDGCGFVWATRDGEDLRSIAADRSRRNSA